MGNGLFHLKTHLENENILFEGAMEMPTFAYSAKDWPHGRSAYHMARHCEACILVYDVTRRSSFEALSWYHHNFYLERSLERPYGCFLCRPSCAARPPFQGLFYVIANKIDYDQAEWQVSIQEGEDFSPSIGAIYLQMSAQTGEGVGKQTVVDMANEILWQRVQNKDQLQDKRASGEQESRASSSQKRHSDTNERFWY